MVLNIRNFVSWIGQLIRGGTTGSVLFVDANGAIGQDNANLFWDDSNNRLGINTAANPQTSLQVVGVSRINRTGSTTQYFQIDGGDAAGIYLTAKVKPLYIQIDSATTIVYQQNGVEFARMDSTEMNIGVGGASNASAILQADSTTKGFLPPRLTTTQKNAVSSPATGLVVYDTTLNKLSVFTGATWETVTSI